MDINEIIVRQIISETDFFRNKNSGAVFGGTIYLGKYDAPENYEEITEEEYNLAVEEENKQAEERLSNKN